MLLAIYNGEHLSRSPPGRHRLSLSSAVVLISLPGGGSNPSGGGSDRHDRTAAGRALRLGLRRFLRLYRPRYGGRRAVVAVAVVRTVGVAMVVMAGLHVPAAADARRSVTSTRVGAARDRTAAQLAGQPKSVDRPSSSPALGDLGGNAFFVTARHADAVQRRGRAGVALSGHHDVLAVVLLRERLPWPSVAGVALATLSVTLLRTPSAASPGAVRYVLAGRVEHALDFPAATVSLANLVARLVERRRSLRSPAVARS